MLTNNDLERERYEARLKYQRDEKAQREYGLEEAREEGRKEGLAGRIQLCERLLKQAITPSETLIAMSLEQLREVADRLEAQLTTGK